MTLPASILLLLCVSALAQVPPFPIVAPPPPFRVTLTWDAQPDPVRVHYADASKAYTFTLDVIGTNRVSIPIPDDRPTYFALTSYNLTDESKYSEEVSWTPPPVLTNVIVTVRVELEVSDDLKLWTRTNADVCTLTNPPGMRFWRAPKLAVQATHF